MESSAHLICKERCLYSVVEHIQFKNILNVNRKIKKMFFMYLQYIV